MALREDIVYRYDGTMDGMLTCIFESYARRESPSAILSPREAQYSLFETHTISTDRKKAERVVNGLRRTAGSEAADLVQLSHLTCLPEKEKHALSFTRLAMKTGPRACSMLADHRVNIMNRAVRFLQIEAHHLCGFIRFTESDGTLVALITPRNNVLPLLDEHFSDRFPEERFIIYDRNRMTALMHLPGMSRIVPINEMKIPVVSERELDIQRLWRRFHQTIAIEGRVNPKLQRNLMPLRFRPNMTEFQHEGSFASVRPALSMEGE